MTATIIAQGFIPRIAAPFIIRFAELVIKQAGVGSFIVGAGLVIAAPVQLLRADGLRTTMDVSG
jgi:hypothetical protein